MKVRALPIQIALRPSKASPPKLSAAKPPGSSNPCQHLSVVLLFWLTFPLAGSLSSCSVLGTTLPLRRESLPQRRTLGTPIEMTALHGLAAKSQPILSPS